MEFLHVKAQQALHNFNWDDFQVGNISHDDSQGFFGKKHYEHEPRDDMEFLRQQMTKTEITEPAVSNVDSDKNKENIKQIELKEELSLTMIKTEITEPAVSNVDTNKNKENIKQNELKELSLSTSINTSKEAHNKTLISPNNVIKKPSERQKLAVNLACEWSSKKVIKTGATSKGAISKVMPPPPQAYLAKDIYQKRREEAERRRAEEERKKREFHSRPVPNFEAHHEQLQKLKSVHCVTAAITPQVLKKSQELEEKRRKRMEEWKLKNQPPKFECRPPTILKEKPFVPEKKQKVVKQCPFKLHVEKRLQERKSYDELKHKALEEKQKQEEEERAKLEKERIKELRKAATFKARPNPFKN